MGFVTTYAISATSVSVYFPTDNTYLIFLLNYALGYVIVLISKLFSSITYHPKFFRYNDMKLSDVVNKVGGNKKEYEVLSEKEYNIKKAEFINDRWVAYTVVVSLCTIGLISVILNNLGVPISYKIETIIINLITMLVFYYLSLYTANSLATTLNNKKVKPANDLVLLIVFLALFAFSVLNSYFGILSHLY